MKYPPVSLAIDSYNLEGKNIAGAYARFAAHSRVLVAGFLETGKRWNNA